MDCFSFHFVPFLPYVAIYPTTTLGQSSYNNHYGMTIGILTKLCQNLGGSFWMRFQKMVLKVGIALPTHNNVNHFITPSLYTSSLITPTLHYSIIHPHPSPPFTTLTTLAQFASWQLASHLLYYYHERVRPLRYHSNPSLLLTTLFTPLPNLDIFWALHRELT